MKYAKGVCWVDDTRIPFVDEVRTVPVHSDDKKTDGTLFGLHPTIQHKREITTQGRFTPNLLVCDDMLNDGSVSKSGGRTISKSEDTNIKNNVYNVGWVRTGSDVKDRGSSSRYYDLDKWFDKIIDNL